VPVAQRGSHVQLTHSDCRGGTVPVHAGKTLKPKTLTAIPDQAGPTFDKLREALYEDGRSADIHHRARPGPRRGRLHHHRAGATEPHHMGPDHRAVP